MIDGYLIFLVFMLKYIKKHLEKRLTMSVTSDTVGRFAPSPSGYTHLGNLASYLLAWLDARSVGGSIILRIEDLDLNRCSESFAEQIADDLQFLGLDWDNELRPEFYQSRRTSMYEDIFRQLMKHDMLYPCYCSRSQRLAASAPHPGEYSHDTGCRCKYLSYYERLQLEKAGKTPAWKIRVPDKEIVFTDGHYGAVRQNLADDGDFIVRRSDGVFAYQLAVSFDDMAMGVNRVVRGRDLLNSTAKQIWLINELGGIPPEYCHAPLLISESGKKLSKRDGDLSIIQLRKSYSAEEIIGFLAKQLNIGDCKPTGVQELLNRFDWSLIPKNDIILK